MKNQVLKSWAGKAALSGLLLTTTINAANFAGVNHSSSGTPFSASAGTSDSYATAWTYASYDWSGHDLYLYTANWWSATENAEDNYYNGISPVYTDSLDDGVLWDSSTRYFGDTDIWFSFNGGPNSYYLGATAYAYH